MRVYYKGRDWLVRDVKRIGQAIIDRADDIVGDWGSVYKYSIIGEVSVDTVPTLRWEKSARITGYEAKESEEIKNTEAEVNE